MTPLATVIWLAQHRKLPNDGRVLDVLAIGWIRAGAAALAVGEPLGDKMRLAPDRIVVPGLTARILTGGLAGAALASRRDQFPAALIGAAAAVASSHVTFDARAPAMRRFGQRPTELVEDALVVACALWIANVARQPRTEP